MIIQKLNYDRLNFLRDIAASFYSNFRLYFALRKRKNSLEEERINHRGIPLLKINAAGQSDCISCMLCKNYCPSKCIHIEADQNEDDSLEIPPTSFEIEVLRCISCGLCLDICPTEALEIKGNTSLAGHAEQEWSWTMEQMLSLKEEVIEEGVEV